MSSQVTNVNWTNILRLSICSASLAALGFWAWKYKLKHHPHGDSSSLWKVISDFFTSSKSAAKKTFAESLENVGTSLEEWIELLKDKYLTEETQEVLDNIKVLIGKSKILHFPLCLPIPKCKREFQTMLTSLTWTGRLTSARCSSF